MSQRPAIKRGITPAYSERDNPYMASSQWICALGKSISYTYHNFIAYDRRTTYSGWRYKLLRAQLAKVTVFARAAQRFFLTKQEQK